MKERLPDTDTLARAISSAMWQLRWLERGHLHDWRFEELRASERLGLI